MRKAKKAAILVCVIVLGFLVVDSIVIFPWEQPHLFWGVSVGDEFVFNATAYGLIDIPPYYPVESISLSIISGSTVIVRIESLPSSDILSESDFLDLVDENKVSIRFTNGSDIPSNISSTLDALVSRFFIPVGDWNFLDRMFPDTPSDAGQLDFGCNTYLSSLHNTSFSFGHRYFNVDAGSWWHGNVSRLHGVPIELETTSASYHPSYVSFRWTFRLYLVTG